MHDILLTPIRLNELETLIENSVLKALKENQSINHEQTENWFSIEELCNYLPGNPAKATIYAKVHQREIPHKKFGKRLAFLKSEIDLWLKSQGRKTNAEIQADTEEYLSKKKGGIK